MPRNKSEAFADELRLFDSLPDSANVRQSTVKALYGVSDSTIWRWVRSKHIPAPINIGPNVTVWNVGELRANLKKRIAR